MMIQNMCKDRRKSLIKNLIKNNASLIIDTRNVYPLNNDKNIFRLGVGKSE